MSGGGFGGRGWAFPIGVAADGTVRRGDDEEETVRNAIWTVLSTAPGERVMRPDYGCGIDDHVFAPNGPGTTGALAEDVREALQEWEPRIDVIDVTAAADPADPGRLLVEITYLMRTTNSRLNLVYPFYLE